MTRNEASPATAFAGTVTDASKRPSVTSTVMRSVVSPSWTHSSVTDGHDGTAFSSLVSLHGSQPVEEMVNA